LIQVTIAASVYGILATVVCLSQEEKRWLTKPYCFGVFMYDNCFLVHNYTLKQLPRNNYAA